MAPGGLHSKRLTPQGLQRLPEHPLPCLRWQVALGDSLFLGGFQALSPGAGGIGLAGRGRGQVGSCWLGL